MTGIRSIAVRFTVFALVALFLGGVLLNTMIDGLGGSTNSYKAIFSDVSGLRVGDDVRVAGVRVGRVQSIEVSGRDGAEVDFDLDAGQPLLTTTDIVMRYQNLVGQRYLALVQGPERGSEVPDGATIGTDHTDPGFDLTELLNGFRPLFQVLQPGDVNQLATSIVKVLQGEGGTVESLLEQTTQLTTFVADRDAVIGAVLTNLTPVLMNLDDKGDELTATVSELRDLMTGLARDRRSIGDSIEGVSTLVGATSDLLEQARQPTVAVSQQLRAAARLLADNRPQLAAALKSFAVTMSALGRPTSYENALNIYVCTLGVGLGSLALNPAGGNGPFSEACR